MESTIEECRGELKAVQDALRPAVEGGHATGYARIPVNLQSVHEALQWRLAATTSEALGCVERGATICGLILARSSIETAAMIAYVEMQMDRAIKGDSLADVAEIAKRLYLGRRDRPDAVQSINVITCVQHLAGRVSPAVEETFNELCEFAHPNWFGTLGAFGVAHGDEDRYTYEGWIPEPYSLSLALASIWLACRAAVVFRGIIDSAMPRLSAVCAAGEVGRSAIGAPPKG